MIILCQLNSSSSLSFLGGQYENYYSSTSFKNSCGPCCDASDYTLTATTLSSSRIPLYTIPKPPLPITFSFEKLLVALWISPYVKWRGGFVASITSVGLTTVQSVSFRIYKTQESHKKLVLFRCFYESSNTVSYDHIESSHKHLNVSCPFSAFCFSCTGISPLKSLYRKSLQEKYK